VTKAGSRSQTDSRGSAAERYLAGLGTALAAPDIAYTSATMKIIVSFR